MVKSTQAWTDRQLWFKENDNRQRLLHSNEMVLFFWKVLFANAQFLGWNLVIQVYPHNLCWGALLMGMKVSTFWLLSGHVGGGYLFIAMRRFWLCKTPPSRKYTEALFSSLPCFSQENIATRSNIKKTTSTFLESTRMFHFSFYVISSCASRL